MTEKMTNIIISRDMAFKIIAHVHRASLFYLPVFRLEGRERHLCTQTAAKNINRHLKIMLWLINMCGWGGRKTSISETD